VFQVEQVDDYVVGNQEEDVGKDPNGGDIFDELRLGRRYSR
jgi:hypothetical protein